MVHKIVSRHTDGPFRYQAWPTVAKAEDGTLFAAASGHRLNHVCPFGKDLMYVSKDEGETWSCPILVNGRQQACSGVHQAGTFTVATSGR